MATTDNVGNSNKKVLFICPKGSLDAGGIMSNYQLIRYLIAHGYKVKVITSWKGSYNKTLTREGIKNKALDYNWWMDRDLPELVSVRVMKATEKIAREIRSYKPAVVVTNTSHIPWGAWAASMMDVPHIWIVREYPISNFEYLAKKVTFIRQYSNKIMANSEELAVYYRKIYGYDVGHFYSDVDVSELHLNPGEKSRRLVSPNYMSQGKNQIELVKAAAILRQRRGDLSFRVVLMGEKEQTYWPKLQAAVAENCLGDIVDIYDRVSNPWGMIGENDILVQTSLSESIGRTTTEAMKLGITVVATDIPGHREAFRLGGGTLYRVGDADDLANKLEHIFDNPAETKKSTKKAKENALRNMSSDACSGPFIKAINEVAGKDNPVGSNRLIWPYFSEYIKETDKQLKETDKQLAQKNADTDMLLSALDDLRNSRSYKIGSVQAKIIKKVHKIILGGKH